MLFDRFFCDGEHAINIFTERVVKVVCILNTSYREYEQTDTLILLVCIYFAIFVDIKIQPIGIIIECHKKNEIERKLGNK